MFQNSKNKKCAYVQAYIWVNGTLVQFGVFRSALGWVRFSLVGVLFSLDSTHLMWMPFKVSGARSSGNCTQVERMGLSLNCTA